MTREEFDNLTIGDVVALRDGYPTDPFRAIVVKRVNGDWMFAKLPLERITTPDLWQRVDEPEVKEKP
jgi:hypothetical protein